jgi:wyosine [tRNA(Phe)-imidazoG37] synthetase (radical SAM superfamily)
LARKVFEPTERFERELKEALGKAKAEIITFSGSGEPTLAKNLGEWVEVVRKHSTLPVALLTNSVHFFDQEVRKATREFDVVCAKLDAVDEASLRLVNQPLPEIKFDGLVAGIKRMRREFKGKKFALQLMFLPENKVLAGELAGIAREIGADEVQLDTPLRPSPAEALSHKEMETIEKDFKGLNLISVYRAKKPVAKALDLHETSLRRPE